MSTKDKGDRSELEIMAALKSRGYPVLTPFGDNQKYDFVYEKGSEFNRVQAKTGRYDDGKVKFNTATVGHNNTEGSYQKSYSDDDIDVFMIYCPDTDEIYNVPVDDAGDSHMSLRVEEPEFKHPNINRAADFIF